eukprot:3015644-Prymnesium_polylepis.1
MMNTGKRTPGEPRLRDDRYLLRHSAVSADASTLELPFSVETEGVWIGRSLIAPFIIIASLLMWHCISVRTKRKILDVRSRQVAMKKVRPLLATVNRLTHILCCVLLRLS